MERRRIGFRATIGCAGQRVLRELLARGEEPIWSGETYYVALNLG